MSQLNPQQVSLAVKQRKPKCVREAVDAALEVESYLIAWHRYDREKQRNEAVREDRISTTVASSTHLQQLERIVETLKDIQLRLMNCETTQKQHNRVNPGIHHIRVTPLSAGNASRWVIMLEDVHLSGRKDGGQAHLMTSYIMYQPCL